MIYFIKFQSFIKVLIGDSAFCSFQNRESLLKIEHFRHLDTFYCSFKSQEVSKLLSDVDFVSHDGNMTVEKLLQLYFMDDLVVNCV